MSLSINSRDFLQQSRLRSFQLSTLASSTVAIFQSGISVDTCPKQTDGSDELWLSSLWEFLFHTSPFFWSDFSEMADHLPHILLIQRLCFSSDFGPFDQINGPLLPSRSMVEIFQPELHIFSPPLSSGVLYLTACVHLQIHGSRPLWYFGL
jgi:hypothetical protein